MGSGLDGRMSCACIDSVGYMLAVMRGQRFRWLAQVSGPSGRSESYPRGSRYRPPHATDDVPCTVQDTEHPAGTRIASPPGLEGRSKLRDSLKVFHPVERSGPRRRVSVDYELAVLRPPCVRDPHESPIARPAYAVDGGVRLAGGRPGSEVAEEEDLGELLEPPPYSQLRY